MDDEERIACARHGIVPSRGTPHPRPHLGGEKTAQDPHFGVPGGAIEAVRMRFHMHLYLLIAMRGNE